MPAVPPAAEPTRPTFAARMGTTAHCSPLLHRMRAAGLDTPAKLAAAAISRGLPYYAPAVETVAPLAPHRSVDAADLAIALLHPSLPWDPQRIRLAAAILATRGLAPGDVSRLAVQERAVAIVREIASAAASAEPAEVFWRDLLAALPVRPPLPPGLLPHPSRYMAITGRARPGRAVPAVWIRPSLAA